MVRFEKAITRIVIGLFYLLLIPFFVQRYNTMISGELWAEDAASFFPEAVISGAGSIFHPVAATALVLSRTLALLAAQFPLELTPYLYAIASCIVYLAVAFYIVKDSFAWLIPSRQLRVAFAFFIFTVNGTSEIFGTLVCQSYVLAWFAALTLLEDPPLRKRYFIATWVVCALSSNIVPCLLPLTIMRSIQKRGYVWFSTVFCSLSLLLHLLLASNTDIFVSQPKAIPLSVAIQYVLLHYLPMGLYAPIFGPLATANSLYSAELFYLLFLLLLLPLVIYRRELFDFRSETVMILFALQCSVMFFMFMHAYARAYMQPIYPQYVGIKNLFSFDNLYHAEQLFKSRHSWLPALATFLTMAVVFSRLYVSSSSINKRVRYKLLGTILVANALTVVPAADIRLESWRHFEKTIDILTQPVSPTESVSTHTLVVGPKTVRGPWATVTFYRTGDHLSYAVEGGNLNVEK